MSFGGMFEIDGDDGLDPEDFASPFEFIMALMNRVRPESCETNIKLLSLLWGAKTGKNPRYLFADLLAQTADDEMWEKILLPKARDQFSMAVSPAKTTSSEGPVVSAADAEDLRRMFESSETTEGYHRHFAVGSDGSTAEVKEETEPEVEE